MDAFETLLQQTTAKVIDAAAFVAVDLSASNASLADIDVSDSDRFEDYIENYLAQNNADAAFGGYNENRNLYKRSAIFNDDDADERNIHIGLDIWIKAGTPVFSALDGKVHSFDYNTGIGNYGPTIILEHRINDMVFYTLYGHLSLESIEEIEIGDVFGKGQKLAALGDASVNGDYAPHLHFQIIRDIGGAFGDYAGVCSAKDLDFYLQNCPDPNLLLKLKNPL
jgi:murein DD-endopeptidase MepM/ murein hydrolase activator NlpD